MWWHVFGAAIVNLILVVVPENHQSFSYVFTERFNNSGYSDGSTSSPTYWRRSVGGGGVAYIFTHAMDSKWAAVILTISCIGQFFCTTSCMTRASRMTFAFSRDGARQSLSSSRPPATRSCRSP